MRKIILFLFLLSISGCSGKIKIGSTPISGSSAIITNSTTINNTAVDSLKTILQKDSILINSLYAKIKQQKILITFTAEKCHKYATIVKNKPSQSIFIVGWIDRAFLWTKEK